jgi:hypothetical protein
MIDDPAFFFEFTSHIAISITAKFLGQGLFNILYYYYILKELSIHIYALSAGPYSPG